MRRSVIETVLGGVVLIVAAVFLLFAYASSDLQPVVGYDVTARFNSVAGLTNGSDARIGGVKIGTVTGMRIDEETYQAVVTLSVRSDVRLPTDTLAVVTSDGLLGGKYVRLEPGGSQERLVEGGVIRNTKDVVALEELLGKVIFLVTDQNPAGG